MQNRQKPKRHKRKTTQFIQFQPNHISIITYNYNLKHYVRKSQWTLMTWTPVIATIGTCMMENALGYANFPAIVCELPRKNDSGWTCGSSPFRQGSRDGLENHTCSIFSSNAPISSCTSTSYKHRACSCESAVVLWAVHPFYNNCTWFFFGGYYHSCGRA